MTPEQYHSCVLAQLDAMRSAEKDRILIGLIGQLYPGGDPDHEVSGADFIAEAVRLLAAFHAGNIDRPSEATASLEQTEAPEF